MNEEVNAWKGNIKNLVTLAFAAFVLINNVLASPPVLSVLNQLCFWSTPMWGVCGPCSLLHICVMWLISCCFKLIACCYAGFQCVVWYNRGSWQTILYLNLIQNIFGCWSGIDSCWVMVSLRNHTILHFRLI